MTFVYATLAFNALTLLVGVGKSIRPRRNLVMVCRCGAEVRCKLFAYGPADATAIVIFCLV